MAIAFARMNIHSRTAGHSAVKAAAYRAGSILYEERTGETHDYSNRTDVAYTEILLPQNAHDKFLDREFLWNQVEHAEKRKDAQVSKDLILALPKDLDFEKQLDIAKRFAREHFVNHGLAVDLAIHAHQDNPHAHLLMTTRRLEYNCLSAKKARDLNPLFYGKDKKQVFDYWGEKWRDFQNSYFQENNIDLIVDPEYLIATRHEGRLRNKSEVHYIKEENVLRREASLDAFRDPEVVLEYLSTRYATFSEKELSAFVFKHTHTTEAYQALLTQIKASKQMVFLGYGEDGRERYTTRATYLIEEKLINQVVSLVGREDKAIAAPVINKIALTHGLTSEQLSAIQYLTQKGDIACLVGRAGTGKTHAMKAIQEIYQSQGYQIYGAALSGIAARELEVKTGIQSDTIHSLCRRIEKGRFQPAAGSVIVIDEAGMIGLQDMARLVDFAKQSRCKLILLGDPDQLQPIMAGAPFRAIIEHVGFAEMQHIQRQRDPGDREASRHLSAGRIGQAIDHYAAREQFKLCDPESAKANLIQAWQQSLSKGIENQIILAHTRDQVTALNTMARQVLLEQGLISRQAHTVQTARGQISLAQGDRIVFLENNKKLNVFNGSVGKVLQIEGTLITAQVEHRTVTFDTRQYPHFNHGYATTVHKSQGATVDRAFVYMEGAGWDRFLTYVAMTRHRDHLQVFASHTQYRDLDDARRQLSRAPIRDNAIDYHLSYATRRGFDPDSTLGRALNHLAGIGHRIKNSWLYITQYENWVLQRKRQARLHQAMQIRTEARKVAEYADLNQQVKQGWAKLYKGLTDTSAITAQPGYAELKGLTAKRNQLAYEIYSHRTQFERALQANRIDLAALETYAEAHTHRERVLAFAQTPSSLLRGRLAREIVASPKAHHKYVQEFQIDWKTIRLEQWKLEHRERLIRSGQLEAYQVVDRYVRLRRDVAKAWDRVNAESKAWEHANAEFTLPGYAPNLERNTLRAHGLTAQMDKLAHQIYAQPAIYQEALEFYKVDEKGLERCHNRYLYRQRQWEQPSQNETAQTTSIIHRKRWNVDVINQALMANPEETYAAIFGQAKKRSAKEMRFPGGLIVTTRGTHAGQWYSFTAGQGGAPIQAIQYQLGFSYAEALEYGARIAGLSEFEATYDDVTESIRKRVKSLNQQQKQQEKQEKAQRIEKARQLLRYAKPVPGTLAETYLSKHRGIQDIERMGFQYLPAYKNSPPALVLPAYNANGEITAIQRVFLSPETGNKNQEMETAKISTGVIKGAAGIVQQGESGGRVYIAEGPETAASIAMADPKATVLASFSVSNLGHLADGVKRYNTQEVIIAADNDGPQAASHTAFEKAVQSLQNAGLSVTVKRPGLLPGFDKTDWNDVLKAEGIQSIRQSLGLTQAWDWLKAPEWMRLNEGQGRLFKEHAGLLLRIRSQILDNLHDKAKVDRLMVPAVSLINKILKSDRQRAELQRVAPVLVGKLQVQIKSLNLKYGKTQDWDRERGR